MSVHGRAGGRHHRRHLPRRGRPARRAARVRARVHAPTGTTSPRRGRERRGRARRRAAARRRTSRSSWSTSRAGDGAGRGRASSATRRRELARRRHHRHERQDDHGVPRARRPRGGAAMRPACWARSSRASAACAEPVARTTPESDRPAGDVAAHGRRRRPRLRDGGVVARARARPRRRRALRRRRVHEPHPGPPRLPSRHGATTSPPRRGCSTSRCPGAINVGDPCGRRLAGIGRRPVLTYARASDATPTCAPHAVEIGAGGAIALIVSTPRGPLPLDVRLRGGFNVENVLCAVALGASCWSCRTRPSRAGSRRCRASPGRFEAGRGRPAVHGARRLRAHAGRARERAARRRAASPRGRADRACSAAAATATAASAR